MADIVDVVMKITDLVTPSLNEIRENLINTRRQHQYLAREINGVSRSLGSMADAMAPIAGASAAIGAIGVKSFMDFDATVTAAGVKAGATAEELEQMREVAGKLGAEFPISANDAAEGMDRLAAGGFNAQQVMGAMPAIIEASVASGEDLAATSDVITSALDIWNLRTGDVAANTTHVADVIQAAANSSKLGMQDFGLAMQYAGAPAATLGISIEELGAAMGVMANNGIEASTIGTSLRATLSRLSAPPKDAAAAIAALGLQTKDSSGNFIGLNNVIEQLRNSMSGLSDTEQVAMAKSLAGEDAYSGLLALVRTSPEAYAQVADAINDSAGSSEAAFNKMNDTLKGSVDQLKGAAESAAIALGQALAPQIRTLAGYGQTLATALTDMSPGMRSLIIGAGEGAIALTGLLYASSKVAGIAGTLVGIYGDIGRVLYGTTIRNRVLQYSVLGVRGAYRTISSAASNAMKAIRGTGAASEAASLATVGAWPRAKEAVSSATASITASATAARTSLASTATAARTSLVAMATSARTSVVGAFASMKASVVADMASMRAAMTWNGISNSAKAAMTSLSASAASAQRSVTASFAAMKASAASSTASMRAAAAWNSISGAASTAMASVTSSMTSARAAVSSAATSMAASATTAKTSMLSMATAARTTVVGAFSTMKTRVIADMASMQAATSWNNISNNVSTAMNALSASVSSTKKSVMESFAAMKASASASAAATRQSVTASFAAMKTSATASAASMRTAMSWSNISGTASTAAASVSASMASAKASVSSAATSIAASSTAARTSLIAVANTAKTSVVGGFVAMKDSAIASMASARAAVSSATTAMIGRLTATATALKATATSAAATARSFSFSGAISTAVSGLANITRNAILATISVARLGASFAISSATSALSAVAGGLANVARNGLIATASMLRLGVSFAITSVIGGAATAFRAVAGAIAMATRASLAFAFSPVGLAIMALAGTAYLLYTHWEQVSKLFQGLGTILRTAFMGALNSVRPALDNLQAAWQRLMGVFQQHSATINMIISIFKGIAMVMGGVVVANIYILASVLTGVLTAAFDVVAAVVNMGLGIFTGLIDFVTGVFTGNWSAAWNGVVEIFSSIFGGIAGIAQGVLNGVKAAINAVIGGINSISVSIPDWVPGVGGSTFGPLGIPYLARGTDNWFGGPAVINEHGGEIVDLPSGARVIPHDQSLAQAYRQGSMSNGGSKPEFNIYISGVTVNNGQDIKEIAMQVAREIEYKLETNAVNLNVGAI